jgi:3-oxoisoapionate decarboxylase
MTRRRLLKTFAAAPLAAAAAPSVKLGADLFSLRSQGWTPYQLLDYCAARQVQVVHFSEIRFIGGLEPDNLRRVRDHAAKLAIELEIGMVSICPTSKRFNAAAGTAEAQLGAMIDAAVTVGSRIVRCVLGDATDRIPSIERSIETTARVLRNVRSKAVDSHIKVAIENHAGDMQARELKSLIEQAGPDFTGVCIDSGNPLWTIEDPHLTLETLAPYVLTSHLRDSAVWRVPEGAAVSWVRMGEGNVDIEGYVRKYAALCPGRALSIESIVTPPRVFPFHDPKFWEPYRSTPAWEFERFLEIADRGKPRQPDQRPPDQEAARRKEREDFEASLEYLKKLLR